MAYKANVYTYKTDELPICYNLTAQNYAIQSIHFVIVSYISSYKSYNLSKSCKIGVFGWDWCQKLR